MRRKAQLVAELLLKTQLQRSYDTGQLGKFEAWKLENP